MPIDISKFQKEIIIKSKKAYIRGMDWQDIVQELNIHLWQKAHKFDPSKSSERTFVNRLITNKICDLARRANAQKRFAENYSISLDRLIEGGFDVALFIV